MVCNIGPHARPLSATGVARCPRNSAKLSSMRTLTFKNNRLSGTLPTELNGMVQLSGMYFAGNRFPLPVPDFLSRRCLRGGGALVCSGIPPGGCSAFEGGTSPWHDAESCTDCSFAGDGSVPAALLSLLLLALVVAVIWWRRSSAHTTGSALVTAVACRRRQCCLRRWRTAAGLSQAKPS